MNRRQIITAGAMLTAMSASALAQTTDHSHDHAGHGSAAPTALLDTAATCVKVGQVCLDHCLVAFAANDTSLAACARSSDQMTSICATLAKLASSSSPYLPAMAKVALAACQDCEKECKKHADKHASCKACAEACAACAAECKKIAA
ncbi:MAG: four-helix bundle copper-binding protein [Bradyrhizobium sp.]|uniref:Csp1 family four helix bundle copper storage protein n=1 Tax=Bradyrhizobium sp. TaxID=376 RepID=UPI0025C5A6E1|nr:Csp1 family four helix bundle copper storage protein [Bradyrhizobium sp.]MBI5260705.1 four-helix bundle copper-binding protein [Bradyrhizobium sp.]